MNVHKLCVFCIEQRVILVDFWALQFAGISPAYEASIAGVCQDQLVAADTTVISNTCTVVLVPFDNIAC